MNVMKKYGASGLPMPREVSREIRTALKEKGWDLYALGNACGCTEEFLTEVFKGRTPISRHLVTSLEFALGAPRGRWQLEVGYLPTSICQLGKANPQITALFHRLSLMDHEELARFADSHVELLQTMELVDTLRQHKLTPGSRVWQMAQHLIGETGPSLKQGAEPC